MLYSGLLSMPRYYLDNNSTTPLLPEVAQAVLLAAKEHWGNPASAHRQGATARLALEEARSTVARCLGAFPDEVIFTSGATEANNLALFGLAAHTRQPGSLVYSRIEHPSVIEPCNMLIHQGWRSHEWAVDPKGYIQHQSIDFREILEPSLVAIQLANHETGVVQDIARLRALCANALFHTDATQAVGKIPVNFHELGVTTLSCSAHKFHGPSGIGILLINRCAKLSPRLHGGHQQKGIRPGTEPVALAVGLATALQLACDHMLQRQARGMSLRQTFLAELRRALSDFVINGDADHGLPHTINLSFPGCPSDMLFIRLDLAGVDCSTGSACSSGSLLPSPVLQAMNVPDAQLHSAMRFSLSHLLTENDVTQAAQCIAREVTQLRCSRPG